MLRLMGEREELTVVADQRGTPTYAADLAGALVEFVKQDARSYGAYHYTNSGETTWHGFALAIRDEALARGMLEASIPVHPVTSAEYPTKAARPAYSVLAKERIRRELGIGIPEWRDGLVRYLDRVAAARRDVMERSLHNVLVTGGSGFIGSNFIRYVLGQDLSSPGASSMPTRSRTQAIR